MCVYVGIGLVVSMCEAVALGSQAVRDDALGVWGTDFKRLSHSVEAVRYAVRKCTWDDE